MEATDRTEPRQSPRFVFTASMAYMIAVDGVINPQEFRPLIATLGGSDAVMALTQQAIRYVQQVPVEEFLAKASSVLSPNQRLCVLVNLLGAMFADDRADPKEEALFYRFCEVFETPKAEAKLLFQAALVRDNGADFFDD